MVQAYPINQVTDGELRLLNLESWDSFSLSTKIYSIPRLELLRDYHVVVSFMNVSFSSGWICVGGGRVHSKDCCLNHQAEY